MRLLLAVLILFQGALTASAEPTTHQPMRRAVSAVRVAPLGINLADLAAKADINDVAYAAAVAKANAAVHREACWQAWHNALVMTQPAKISARGMALAGQGGATQLEVKAQAKDAWGDKSAFQGACLPVARSMGMTLDAFVRAATK